MKVLMLRNKMGSNDGTRTEHYEKDETYEVSEDLGAIFLRDGDAEGATEAKAVAAAPKNKAIDAAPANKSE